MNTSRLAVVAIILALFIFGASLEIRSQWLGKIAREQQEETVTIGITFAGKETRHDTEETRKRIEVLARLAEERVNVFSYENGSRFRFQFLAKDCDPHYSVSGLKATMELKDMGIDLIVGHESSLWSVNSLIYANENDVLLLSPAELKELAVNPGDNLFSAAPMASLQGAAIAETLIDMERNVVVVIQHTDMRTNQIYRAFSDAYANNGGTILERLRFYGYFNHTTILSRAEEIVEGAVESYGEDHIAIFVIAYSDVLGMVKDAVDHPILMSLPWFGTDRTTGFSSKAISAANYLSDVDVRQLLAQVGLFSLRLAPTYNEEYRALDEMFFNETGRHLDFSLATKYDCCWLLALSVIEADSPNATDVRSVLPSVASRYFGITGSCALDEDEVRQTCSYDLWGWCGTGERIKCGYYNSTSGSVEWIQSEFPLGREDAARIEIYRAVIHDMYNRSSFTRGRKVPIFISPVYRISTHGDGSSGYLPSTQPSEDRPLLLGLLEALEDLPAKKVSFARREEVVSPMSTGGTVRGGGAFITIETTTVSNYVARVEASIHYGNLGAEGYRYVLGKIDDSWTITEVEMTWIA